MKGLNKKKFLLIYILSFSVPLVLSFIGMILGRFEPFGDRVTLSACNSSDYIPYYYELYDKVHEGKSLIFGNTSTLGYDFTGLFTYKISDPLNLIILLFSRELIPVILNILYVFKISFAGLAMSIFLCRRKSLTGDKKDSFDKLPTADKKDGDKKNIVIGFKNEPKTFIGKFFLNTNWMIVGLSCAYALSITMLTIGMNSAYTTAIAILPLVILGIEKIMSENRPALFIITFTLSIFLNIHISMITGLFVLLYFFTREFKDSKDFVIRTRTFIISLLFSVMGGGFIIINSLGSGFFKKDISLYFPVFNIDNPLDMVKQLMTKNTPSMYSLYDNIFDITFGVGFIFLIILYMFISKIKMSSRIKNMSLLIFIFLGTGTTTFRHLFNGLSVSAAGEVHYGYIIVFLGLLMSYDALNNIDLIKPKHAVISGVLSFMLVLAAMLFATDYDNFSSFIVSLEFIFGYIILTLVYSSRSLTKNLYKIVLFALLMFEICPNYLNNAQTLGTYYISQGTLRNKEFQKYQASRIIHRDEPNARVMYYNYDENTATPFTTTFAGYDYVISQTEIIDSTLEFYGFYSPENSKNGVNIYKNKYNMNNALYDTSVAEYVYDPSRPFSSANIFTNSYLQIGNLFEIGEKEVHYMESVDGSSISFVALPYISGDMYIKAYSISHLGNYEEFQELNFTQSIPKIIFPAQHGDYELGALNEDVLSAVYDNYNIPNMINFDSQATLTVGADCYLATGISNVASFKYTVNGKDVKPVTFIDDNALIPLTEGDNTINITYNPVFLLTGLFVTLLGIILAIAFVRSRYTDKGGEYIEKLSRHFQRNYVYYIVLVAITGLFILSQMVTSSYPFGVNPAISGDGLSQGYTSIVGQINEVKAGKPFAIVSYGIGGFSDMYHTILYDIMNPWLFLKYYILPESLFLFDFTFKYLLNLLFAAFTFIFYLTHKEHDRMDKTDRRLIPLALMYSIGSYAAVFYIYEGLKFTYFLPLIILGLEQLMYHKKKALYICIMFHLMIYDPYHTFLLCIFLAMYFFTMEFSSVKDFFMKGIRFALCSIAAAGLAAFSLYSYFTFTQNSSYVKQGTEGSVSLLKSFSNFITFMTDYRVGNVFGSTTENNSQAAIYAGLILLFVIPLYAMCKKEKLSKRIRIISLVLLLYISFNNELLNFIFHGLHQQSLVPNRYAIFFVFVMINMLTTIILNIKDYNSSKLQITVLCISFVYALLYFANRAIPKLSLISSLIFIFIYLAIIVVYTVRKISNQKLIKYMLLATVAELILNFMIVFPNQIAGNSYITAEAEKINKISDAVPDTKKFYNLTEYLGYHPLYYNIGCMTDIHTLSYFTSAYTYDINDRITYYNLPSGANSMDYHGGNPLADMMLDIKYQIEDVYDDSAYSIYNKIYTYNNFNVYQNPNHLSLGIMTENYEAIEKIKLDDYAETDAFSYQNDLAKALGGTDIFTPIEVFPYEEGDEEKTDKSIFSFGEAYTFTRDNSQKVDYIPVYFKLDESIKGKIYASVEGRIYCIGEVNEDNHELMLDYQLDQVKEKDFYPSLAIYDEEAMLRLHDKLSENIMTDITENGYSISAKLDTSISGMLYISLPYYDSWDIYVDGQLTEKQRYMGGIGVPVDAGSHSIKMEYHPSGAWTGIAVSVVTLIIIIVYGVVSHKKKKES